MLIPTPFVPTSDALVLPTSTPEETIISLNLAAQILANGGLVAFPTETVYGLGASALSESAVKGIFKAKGRPSDNPLIVHVSDRTMLGRLIPGGELHGICAEYEALMKRFWPGPLSMIFDLKSSNLPLPIDNVAPSVRAGSPSVAIRMPSHPIALEVIRRSGVPLAAPSANLSSRPSPTQARHVVEDLGHERGVGAILDGGDCEVGVESTVIDFWRRPNEDGTIDPTTQGEVRILRAGGVSAEEIERCLLEAGFSFGGKKSSIGGEKSSEVSNVKVYNRDFKSSELEERPTTPGMKYKHYSPSNSKVILIRSSSLDTTPLLSEIIKDFGQQVVGLMLTTETIERNFPSTSPYTLLSFPTTSQTSPVPTDLSLYSYSIGSQSTPIESAQRLFAGLRFLDEIKLIKADSTGEDRLGVDVILLECIEEVGVGLAVMERGRKAAGQSNELIFRL